MLAFFSSQSYADETVVVCYGYGCNQQARVRITDKELAPLAKQFASSNNAREERKAISDAIGYLFIIAGRQTPIHRDRGGNYDDDHQKDGAMDCIDHSITTDRWLKLLDRQKWLRYHQVGDIKDRGMLLTIHWTATIVEKDTGKKFAVDRWFFPHGAPAAVMAIENWLGEKDPILADGRVRND